MVELFIRHSYQRCRLVFQSFGEQFKKTVLMCGLSLGVLSIAHAQQSQPEENNRFDASKLSFETRAAIGACWDQPARWTGQVSGHDTDPINIIVCLSDQLSWDQVFSKLQELPGTVFDRIWPMPDYQAPWREVFAPNSPPRFKDNHCINTVQANVNSRGEQDQDVSAREGGCHPVSLFGRGIRDGVGINHFRNWTQTASKARFIAASTEEFCVADYIKPNHCVVSYNGGRDRLVANFEQAAQRGQWPFASVAFKAMEDGSITQHDGRSVPYDGYVRLVLIGF